MKHYNMASVINPSIIKQPLKVIEVPLCKFSEEVVPHHQKSYEQYKLAIQKLIVVNNAEQLKRELKDIKRSVKQLRDVMYELETLRTQVMDSDLDKFDAKTVAVRKIIINLIQGYTDLEKNAEKVIDRVTQLNNEEDCGKENQNPFEGASQIQLHENLDDIKLKNQYEAFNRVQNLNQDVEDLHEIYNDLNQMVDRQGDSVNNIASSVESAQQNVENGARELVKAHKLKAVAYPVTGAFLGGMIGGPIGLVAGLKVGGIAAIGCAIAGYTGGRFFNKVHNPDNIEAESQQQKTSAKTDPDPDELKKKDI